MSALICTYRASMAEYELEATVRGYHEYQRILLFLGKNWNVVEKQEMATTLTLEQSFEILQQ